jgi:hypothetical protein
MHETTKFLSAVLPQTGIYCVVGIKGKKVEQKFVEDFDAVIATAEELVATQTEAYFALASYEDGSTRRTQDKTAAVKAFWLDIDCGEGKPYSNQQEGLEALKEFKNKLNLPSPTVVDSGYGLHVYWALSEEVAPDEWEPVAKRLKMACAMLKLQADPAVTSDLARILRIPNTKNFKRGEERDVVIARMGEPITLDVMVDAFDKAGVNKPVERKPKRSIKDMSPLAQALMANKQSRFSTIAKKSINGTGCNFLRSVIVDQANTEEPMWRAGLSIAWACVDGDKAIHTMSKKHPDYTEANTIEKASQTKGPYGCEAIRELTPEICADCKLNITNPIQLGSEVLRSDSFPTEEELAAEEEAEAAVVPKATTSISIPRPYFRGKNGGIYKEAPPNEEDGPQLIYEHDLYASVRLNDPECGECIVFHLKLPHDRERVFSISVPELNSLDSFKKVFGKQGVLIGRQRANHLMDYAIRYANELQQAQHAKEARLQFGWNSDNTEFAVGRRVYKKGRGNTVSVEVNYPSSTTNNLINYFEPKGDLETWKKIFNTINVPGLEPLQIMALAGFASPLMKFTGVAGGYLNLVSNSSGTGKTTAGRLALSVFGDPEKTMLLETDTAAARQHRMGVLNSLFAFSDEMTNIPVEQLSMEIYGASQGRGRNRMNASSNTERDNSATWHNILGASSNSSMVDKLAKHKARADGELMRLLEISVQRVNIPGAELWFDQLQSNFGIAGDIWARWMVGQSENLFELVDKYRTRLTNVYGRQPQERFFNGYFGSIIAAGYSTQALDLHEFNMPALEKWAAEWVVNQRTKVKTYVKNPIDLLSEFINQNIRKTVVITKPHQGNGTRAVVVEPNGAECNVRLDLADNLMYVNQQRLHEYCVEKQFTFDEFLNVLSDKEHCGPFHCVSRSKNVKMLSHTRFGGNQSQAKCVVFEVSDKESKQLAKDAEVESESAD